MNRIVANGVALDLLRGKRLLVVCDSQVAAHEALYTVADSPVLADAEIDVRRENGNERIFLGPGSVHFARASTVELGFRRDVDVVLIDSPSVARDRAIVQTLRRCVEVRRGEVLRP